MSTYQLTRIRPQTNRVLFEFGVSVMPSNNILNPLDAETQRLHGTGREALDARTDLPSVFEGTTLTMSRNMGYFFNGTDVHFSAQNTGIRGSMSYVTGSHNLKFGMNTTWKNQTESYRSANNWTNMLTIAGRPLQALFESRPPESNELTNIGIYAQDQWTIDRLTINAGLRFDYFNGAYPDHMSAPGATTNSIWVPQGSAFPGATAAIWKDLQPRRHLPGGRGEPRGEQPPADPAVARRGQRPLRGWTIPVSLLHPVGRGPDGQLVHPGRRSPQGDPLNPFPNGELMSPTDNPAFGTPLVTEFFDPNWAFGWGRKAANWE